MKKCNKCNLFKKEEEFYWKNKIDGKLQPYCKKCDSNRDKIRYIDNIEYRTKQKASYRIDNKPKIAMYFRERKIKDINFKLACNLRNRLRQAIKNNQKAGSAVKDLGCTIDELKIHLESQFKPGMSWDNWSLLGWHIDHIIPLAKASTPQELVKLCHYTNLQPLWAKDNLIKGDK